MPLHNQKIYVIDTNVILNDPKCIFNFDENIVCIPIIVLEEIDKLKNGNSITNYNAREFIRILNKLIEENILTSDDILLNTQGGVLKFVVKDGYIFDNLENNVDNKILSFTMSIQKEYVNHKVILVTKDINLRIKAKLFGLYAEDYKHEKINEDVIEFSQNFNMHHQYIQHLYNEKIIICNNDLKLKYPFIENLFENQYFLLKDEVNYSSVLCKYEKGKILMLNEIRDFEGIVPKNHEQRFLLDALTNDNILLNIVMGVAGCGKTLLSILVGIHKVLNEKKYKKIIISKPALPMGGSQNDLGFLPGNIDEKMEQWVKSFIDNIEFLGLDYKFLKDSKIIEIEPLAYLRGRTFNDSFVIIDEAQNTNKLEIKTIISRAGKNSKFIVLGDITQIDNLYLTKLDCGLTHIIKNLIGKEYVSVIKMNKTERSYLADLAINYL